MKPIISLQRVPSSQILSGQSQTLPTTKKSIFGFTLIELIVVITILAILGTIGFLSIGGYSSKARDSARLGDISNMSKSLDLAIITIGSYPTPDAPALTVTYSGGTIWTQGFIGTTVLQAFRSSIAGGGLNKKPVDPLDSTEYTYSSLAYGKAYQIKANYEGDLAQTAWNLPELTTEAKAAPGAPSIVYIKGNYGGLTAKTIVGEFTYVLAVPSIITSLTGTGVREIGTGNTLSGTLLFNGKSLKNASSFNPTTVVYTSTGGTPTTTTELNTLITGLKSAYTTSDITNNSSIATLLSTTGATAITSLGNSIVTNQLGGKVNTSTSGNGGGNTATWTEASGGDCTAVTNSVGANGTTSTCTDNRTYTHAGVGAIHTKTYNLIRIANTWWFNQNLAFPPATGYQGNNTWSTTDTGLYSCPGSNSTTTADCASVSSLGYLYQWSSAMAGGSSNNNQGSRTQGVCPSGWAIPTKADFTSSSSTYWPNDDLAWQGTTTNWSRSYAGHRKDDAVGTFSLRTTYEDLWSSLESSATVAWHQNFDPGVPSRSYRITYPKAYGFSVRCLKN
ncbi:MAG: FISUMP domain-containing protein [Candidatus Gracilibacteria bacterium]|nr:FISUMP domain-containing protein [Candidatus Gracilibacteria bacterium]